MESDGPYKFTQNEDGDQFVFGPGLPPEGTMGLNGEELPPKLNFAYAEGRKAVKIKTPCPSCGFTTLVVDDSGNIVCSFLECKNPTEIANKEGRKAAEKELQIKAPEGWGSKGLNNPSLDEKHHADIVDKMVKVSFDHAQAEKALKDALLCGTGIMQDGKRVSPDDIYSSTEEIELKKVLKDFRELLEIASKMRDAALGIRCEFHSHYATMLDNASEEFAAWKKARGIE
jgi:hypothetical protein